MGNIISIREFISEMYPDAETIPQELLESCEVLFEATKREVQLKVYFQQAFDALRKKKWTVDKIDKEIKKIEKCNSYIKDAQKESIASPKYMKLLTSATYWEDFIKHAFYGVVLGIISYATIKIYAELIIKLLMNGSAMFSRTLFNMSANITGVTTTSKYLKNRSYDKKEKHLVAYEKLRQENEKALKWLKEERERIINGTAKKKKLSDIITGKQESANIFDSIELM